MSLSRTSRSVLKRLVVSLVLVVTLVATPASAWAVRGDYTANGVNIRNRTGYNSVVVGSGYKGQGANVYCYLWNYRENNGDWYYHRNLRTGVKGYSLHRYMRTNAEPSNIC
ncbi:hypothetical protein [Actinomyces qiguomingii]|uniref:hypothetical protein n=1 Tax=Actinomyces qiguomingii TaxID=2057800 RepID=UPI000CA00774|nr:hypothetical protein [Actinomyces qiguomingii]